MISNKKKRLQAKGDRMKTQITIIVATLTFALNYSFAVETKLSKEDRQKMAEMHTKMATCLESDKAMSDCQREMMKSCKDMMEKTGCPMMGMGHMKGMMMGHEEENKSDKKDKE